MGSISFFRLICFVWAAIGIGSRIAMFIMGEKWKEWELNNAYTSNKPKWVYLVGLVAYITVGYTWYQVLITNIRYSWIIGVLVTLSVVKVSSVLFNYNTFRKFVSNTLSNKNRMMQLNISVIVFSVALILLGIYLY